MERIFIIEKVIEGCKITDIVERSYAEAKNLRHLTTICVPFMVDGGVDKKGKWIVHDRYHKQVAKGKASPEKIIKSFNLFGGHTTPPENAAQLIGTFVNEAILFDGLLKELNEELLQQTKKADIRELEIWENGLNTYKSLYAAPYSVPLFAPVPIGFAEYADSANTEYSYVFALPIKDKDFRRQLIAADDYEVKGKKHDISLPLECFFENELKKLWEKELEAKKLGKEPDIEVADAITRLFLSENARTLRKLRKTINDYCK